MINIPANQFFGSIGGTIALSVISGFVSYEGTAAGFFGLQSYGFSAFSWLAFYYWGRVSALIVATVAGFSAILLDGSVYPLILGISEIAFVILLATKYRNLQTSFFYAALIFWFTLGWMMAVANQIFDNPQSIPIDLILVLSLRDALYGIFMVAVATLIILTIRFIRPQFQSVQKSHPGLANTTVAIVFALLAVTSIAQFALVYSEVAQDAETSQNLSHGSFYNPYFVERLNHQITQYMTTWLILCAALTFLLVLSFPFLKLLDDIVSIKPEGKRPCIRPSRSTFATPAISKVSGILDKLYSAQKEIARLRQNISMLHHEDDTINWAGTLQVDINGRIIFADPDITKLFKLNETDICTKNLSDLLYDYTNDELTLLLDRGFSSHDSDIYRVKSDTDETLFIGISYSVIEQERLQLQARALIYCKIRQISNPALGEGRLSRLADEYKLDLGQPNTPVFGIDTNGLINEWNNVSENLTGYTKDDVFNLPFISKLITGTQQQKIEQVMKKSLRGENASYIEFPLQTKDGSRIDLTLHVNTRRNAQGEIIGASGVGLDAAELSKLRQEKINLAQELSRLIRNANTPIFGLNLQGLISEWNHGTELLTEFSKEEVLDESFYSFITDEYVERLQKFLTQTLNSQQTAGLELPISTKSGNRIVILLNAAERRDISGSVNGLLCIGQDITRIDTYRTEIEQSYITRSKELQENMLRSEELQNVLELSPDGFIFINSENTVTMSNPAFNQVTGLKGEKLIGNSSDFFRDQLLEVLDEKSAQVFVQAQAMDSSPAVLTFKSPRVNVLSFICQQILHPGEGGMGSILYFKDITHEVEIDRMKSEFLTTAAHELRTPLASIFGFSELLMIREYDQKRRNDMIETIHSQAKRLKKLLDDLLDLSRIEARASNQLNISSVDIDNLLSEVIKSVEGIDTEWQVNYRKLGDQFIVRCDAEMMRRVYLNILGNAFKYSPANHQVDCILSVDRKPGFISVIVTDRGLGMSESDLDNIGTRFWRADKSGSIPGTGLGMALVDQAIKLHLGELEINSVLGEGTTMTIHIPA